MENRNFDKICKISFTEMSRRRKEVREETEEESVADEDSLGEIKIR